MRLWLLIAALGATAAEAGWKSTSVAGTPRDVVTLDAGVALVAATAPGGAVTYAGSADAGLAPIAGLAGNFKSAVGRGPCLVGLTPPSPATFGLRPCRRLPR